MNLKERDQKIVEEGRERHSSEYLGKLGLEYVDLVEEKDDRGT